MPETKTLFRVRVPAARLKRAERILGRLGLNPGDAVNMLLAQIELLLLVPPFPALVVAMGAFVTIASIVISNTLWDTMLQQHIPRDAISRVSSYDWMVSLVFQPLAFAAIGPFSERFGVEQTLVACVVLGLLANSGVLLVPSVRNLRRVDESTVEEPMGAAASAGDPTDPPLATSV